MKRKFFTLWLLCAATVSFAQTDFLNETENACYLQHKDAIDAQTTIAMEDAFRDMATTYAIKLTYETDLRHILEMREMRKVICDYLQPTDHNQRFWMKRAIENYYKNALDKMVLLSGNDVSSPSMAIIFNNRDYLELTQAQTDTILASGVKFWNALKKEPRKDLWKQELTLLQNTLNDQQLDKFFTLKNSRIALRDAKTRWEALKTNDLTSDLDSAQAVTQMYSHLLKKMKAADIYAYDSAKKSEAWAAIEQYAPLPMLRYYTVDRKAKAKKQGYRGSFNW